jgi:hypothetical protein
VLLVVSVVLFLFAIAQTAVILKQEAGTHAQQIQASQCQNATGSPKAGFYRKHSIFTANARFYWETARFWLPIDTAWPNPDMG